MRFRLHSLSTPFRLLGLSLSVALAAGCSSSGDEGGGTSSSTIPGEPITASGRYDLRADVKAIDATAWDSMVVSHEGAGVWLKPEARGAEWLKPGTVTLIKQRGVLKVGSVTEEGDHLVVENVPADWSEIFESGDFSIAGRTRFDLPFSDDPSELGVRENGAAPVENSAPPPAEPEGAPGAGTQSRPLSMSPLTVAPLGLGKSLLDNVKNLATDGWKVEKHVSGDGDELHYDITLSKDSGGLLARIHAVGTVRNLQTALKVAVQNRVTEQNVFDVHSSGDADLTWEVAISEGSVGYNKIVLPGTSFKQQFFVGELPMGVEVKTGMAIIVGATGRRRELRRRARHAHRRPLRVRLHGDATAHRARRRHRQPLRVRPVLHQHVDQHLEVAWRHRRQPVLRHRDEVRRQRGPLRRCRNGGQSAHEGGGEGGRQAVEEDLRRERDRTELRPEVKRDPEMTKVGNGANNAPFPTLVSLSRLIQRRRPGTWSRPS